MSRRDPDAFAEFVTATQPSLRRTAYLLCGDWAHASDHVQDGLVKVYRRWPRLRDQHALLAYARKAVTSATIDAHRRRSSTELPVERVAERAGTDPTQALVERDALRRALDTLGPRQRACVVLRHYEDLSVAEVADVLGVSEGTVKSQTARGLAALQQALGLDDDLTVDGRAAR